ncbi:putative fibrinogen-like protein 1 [Scophthalmus maximus]|uniref:Fibrinogen-like protein 1 n=1 Tax=Scophthalmus maximus TaxID=52904 RepID=A0A2U9BPY3_SCOMX|nr:fibrinogen-like protein 1 [Scophthalmus maximus]AWP06227.1 putative fibrinogen-like protein 1 [Scophthalmus maximus]
MLIGRLTMVTLGTSVVLLLHLASCLAAPVPCEVEVVHLEAEIQRLVSVINDQHRYIQGLHNSQAQQLEHIPSSHLGPENRHRDCSEVFADGNLSNGLYVIRPDGSPTALTVYCDMSNGGGWTVFQRRRNGKESFDRAWVEYKQGFGDLYSPDGEFWLGNEPLHHLTSQGNYDMRIDMEDFEGNQRFAEYKNFKVDNEKDQYQLHLGEYTGNAGDALAGVYAPTSPGLGSGGAKFSTFDQLNKGDEVNGDAQCLRHSKSGWWFSRCDSGNLNGHYYNGPYQAMTDDGVVWYTWHGWWYSIKSVVMMVRAADLEHPPLVIAPPLGQLDSKATGGDVDPPSWSIG